MADYKPVAPHKLVAPRKAAALHKLEVELAGCKVVGSMELGQAVGKVVDKDLAGRKD